MQISIRARLKTLDALLKYAARRSIDLDFARRTFTDELPFDSELTPVGSPELLHLLVPSIEDEFKGSVGKEVVNEFALALDPEDDRYAQGLALGLIRDLARDITVLRKTVKPNVRSLSNAANSKLEGLLIMPHHIAALRDAAVRRVSQQSLSATLGHNISQAVTSAFDNATWKSLPVAESFTNALLISASFELGDDHRIDLERLGTLMMREQKRYAIDKRDDWAGSVAAALAKNAASVFNRVTPLTPDLASAIRLAALALVAGNASPSGKTNSTLHQVITGITLLEARAASKASLESLILARS
jgi:hypothetical protein